MSEKFQSCDLIIYVCDTRSELDIILNLSEENVEIGKNRCDDDFLQLHLNSRFKVKIVIVTLENWPFINEPQIFNFTTDDNKLIKYIIKHLVMRFGDTNKCFEKIKRCIHYIKWRIQNFINKNNE